MAQIDDYLAELDPESAEIVGDAYSVARGLLPEATEGVSYGMPALLYEGSPLLSVMRAKAHIGIYPYSPAVVTEVLGKLPPIRGLTSAKGHHPGAARRPRTGRADPLPGARPARRDRRRGGRAGETSVPKGHARRIRRPCSLMTRA